MFCTVVISSDNTVKIVKIKNGKSNLASFKLSYLHLESKENTDESLMDGRNYYFDIFNF